MEAAGADDDNECRVCRGGPEDDRPLYTPCLCRGSIGQVHQNCLEEWLAHSNKEICELCYTKYQFIPCYSPNMPDVIPTQVIIMTTLQHIIPYLLSILLRFHVTLFMWIFVMPLCTCWIYRIWLPRTHVLVMNNSTLLQDIISGLTIAAVIVMSFIVIMSFTDFLRNHWDLDNRRVNGRLNRFRRRNNNNNNNNNPPVVEAAVPPPIQLPLNDPVDAIDDARENNLAAGNLPDELNPADEAAILNAMNNNEEEAEMQMALDELIGFRGPWHIAFRNVMWLLLFNAIYIGIFAFIPYNIGLSTQLAVHYYFHPTLEWIQTHYVSSSFIQMIQDYIQLSNSSKNDLQLLTLVTISVGFGLIAWITFLCSWIMSQMHSNVPRVFIHHYVAAFNELTMIMKVGMLLFQRIFILPIILGSLLLKIIELSCAFRFCHS